MGKKLTHRQRCDLVLTSNGKPLRLDSKPPNLFDPVDLASPAEALWLEVKVAYQFREGGERHGGYGAQWQTNVVEDLRKMEAEPLIRDAGLAMIVFNESRRKFLRKDLEIFENVLARSRKSWLVFDRFEAFPFSIASDTTSALRLSGPLCSDNSNYSNTAHSLHFFRVEAGGSLKWLCGGALPWFAWKL